MSLGTADQLYLALRLASIESALDPTEPAPLIVDDLLIQFDDARSGPRSSPGPALAADPGYPLHPPPAPLRPGPAQLDPALLFIHELPRRAVGANGDPA